LKKVPLSNVEPAVLESATYYFCGSAQSLWFLVRKKAGDTWIHKDKKVVSTWNHAPHVMENDFLTLKQKQKNNPLTQQNLFCLQSCDFLRTFFLT
jgi:hypothetical protein